jgi:hypothetical protein
MGKAEMAGPPMHGGKAFTQNGATSVQGGKLPAQDEKPSTPKGKPGTKKTGTKGKGLGGGIPKDPVQQEAMKGEPAKETPPLMREAITQAQETTAHMRQDAAPDMMDGIMATDRDSIMS